MVKVANDPVTNGGDLPAPFAEGRSRRDNGDPPAGGGRAPAALGAAVVASATQLETRVSRTGRLPAPPHGSLTGVRHRLVLAAAEEVRAALASSPGLFADLAEAGATALAVEGAQDVDAVAWRRSAEGAGLLAARRG